MSENGVSKKEKERRKAIKSILAGGVVITPSVLPDKWAKPLLGSVILPAHATTSPEDTLPVETSPPPSNTLVSVSMSDLIGNS